MSDPLLEQTRAVVHRPADFQAFWQCVRAELAAVPLEWERLRGAGGETAAHRVDWLHFSSFNSLRIYGWLVGHFRFETFSRFPRI